MNFFTSYWLWILVSLFSCCFLAGMYLLGRGHAKRTGGHPDAIVGCGHGYFDARRTGNGTSAPQILKKQDQQ